MSGDGWPLILNLPAVSTAHGKEAERSERELLLAELRKLQKQKCPVCDGFGHAYKACPTDRKLQNACSGFTVTMAYLKKIRQKRIKETGMRSVSGLSMLRPIRRPHLRPIEARAEKAVITDSATGKSRDLQ